jgi:quercetin dioxygenase-like cupin family protein
MNDMHIEWSKLPTEQLSPLVERQYVSTPNVTVARFFLRKGASVPEHKHPNEQIAFVLSGAMRFVIEGKAVTLHAGETLCIPPNVAHSAEALEDTIDLDVFTPPRADWSSGDDSYLRK